MKREDISLVSLILFFLFLGCESNNSTGIRAGYLSGLEGVNFETPTQSGKTDAMGAFFYKKGETVVFSVGDVIIGETRGSENIDLFTLANIDVPKSTDFKIVARKYLFWKFSSGIISPETVSVIRPYADGMDRVINLAVFLQTLDADSNLENGIQITSEVHRLFAQVSVDFNQDSLNFFRRGEFSKGVALGRNQGLWNGIKAIINPGIALNNLCSDLGIEMKIPALMQIETRDAKSFLVDSSSSNFWDEAGNLISHEFYDRDKKLASVFDAEVNEGGNITELKINDFNEEEYVFDVEYDGNGNIISAIFNNQTIYKFFYNSFGYIEKSEIYENGRGAPIIIAFYTCDDIGRIIQTKIGSYVLNYSYIGDNLIKVEKSFKGGPFKSCVTYSYADSIIEKIEKDLDTDGYVDIQESISNDANGNMISAKINLMRSGTIYYAYAHNYVYADGDCIGFDLDVYDDDTIDYESIFVIDFVDKFGNYGSQYWKGGFANEGDG